MTQPHDPMMEIRAGFFLECDELLERLTDSLDAQGFGTLGDEAIHTAFRAVHSVKGGAAAFDLTDLVSFAHGVETHLDLVRSGKRQITSVFCAALLRSADHLAVLVNAARHGTAAPQNGADFLAALGTPAAPATAFGTPALPNTIPDQPWRIHFHPHAQLYTSGNDPLHLLNALTELGDAEITCDWADLPNLQNLMPETGVLAWTILLPAHIPEAAIRETFEFVEDVCDLVITRDCQAIIPGTAIAHNPAASATATHTPSVNTAADMPTVRVDLDRIDRLMNLVGELAIGQSMLAQTLDAAAGQAIAPDQRHRGRYSPTALALDSLGTLTRDIQDAVMRIRAQPVKPLFQRMSRILREASAVLGKPAELICLGETTEVDRSVIERLAEPLTHMIRNAVDHGLELAETRRMQGKPETGTVTLSASHRAGRIIVELADDGSGINREHVRTMAVERGLIDPDLQLSDAEIDALLFHPGFSTAATVSAISGRGVGMDVVQTAIRALGGRIAIQSTLGQGTRFTLSLPLTLAVLDGMVVRAGGQTFILPLAAILETAAITNAGFRELQDGQQLIRLRDQYTSVCDLAATLGYTAQNHTPARRIAILITDENDQRMALLVDQVIDQRQVVIKGLSNNCGVIPGIAAATILGDGHVALILDPGELIHLASLKAAATQHIRLAG